MKESFTEFNDLLKTKLEEVLKGGEYYIWYVIDKAITKTIRELVGDVDEVSLPVTISSVYYSQGNMKFIVKTKKTSTKLVSINVAYHYDTQPQKTRLIIDGIESFKESKIAQSLYDLKLYLEDRVTKLSMQQINKEAPFRQELASSGIEVKDFVTLYKIYEKLDAPTRRKLWSEGEK